MLIEVAPGVDLDRDILTNMDFKALIAPELTQMDARIVTSGKMNIKY